MIKTNSINKTTFLFSVLALLISLFISTPLLASDYRGNTGELLLSGGLPTVSTDGSYSDDSKSSPGSGSGLSSSSISRQVFLAGAVTVFAVSIPLSRYAYSSFQSWWNKDDDLLENFVEDEDPSKNSVAQYIDKHINEPKENDAKKLRKARDGFLNDQGQGIDKNYEGEESWSLSEDERAGGGTGFIGENAGFSNQHNNFNTRDQFHEIDLSGKVKDLNSEQMPEGINKAAGGDETIVDVRTMNGLRALVQLTTVKAGDFSPICVPGDGSNYAFTSLALPNSSDLMAAKKIRLRIFKDFLIEKADVVEAKNIIVHLLSTDNHSG